MVRLWAVAALVVLCAYSAHAAPKFHGRVFLQLQAEAEAKEDAITTQWKQAVDDCVTGFVDSDKDVAALKGMVKDVSDKSGEHPLLKKTPFKEMMDNVNACPDTHPVEFKRCAQAEIQTFLKAAATAGKCKAPAPEGAPNKAGARVAGANMCQLSIFDCSNGAPLNEEKCKCECTGNWSALKCDKCGLKADDCKHGSTFNDKDCKCEGCKDPWSGITCNKCTLTDTDCNNGQLIPDGSCRCGCNPGWRGDRCDRCIRTKEMCQERGHADDILVEKCVCKCSEGWKGEPYCNECARSDAYCSNGGKIDLMTCVCDCEAPWSGDKCDQCTRKDTDCKNGAKLNPKTCMCDIDCPPQFKGELCGACNLDGLSECQHGSWLDEKVCSCVGGEFDGKKYKGTFKETCARTADNCHKIGKGTFSAETCTCQNCVAGWVGELCDTCIFTDDNCVARDDLSGKIDRTSCTCQDCPPGWGGDFCKKCLRTEKDCSNGSKFNAEKCNCDCDTNQKWTGDTCTVCSLDPDACINGSKFSRETCKCMQCNEPWSGDYSCGTCTLTAGDCKHGEFAGAAQCTCTPCQGNWIGYKCDTCGIKKAEECLNGGKFLEADCKCSCNQWDGTRCETCVKSAIEPKCKHGGKFRADKCDCLQDCPPEWTGDGDIFCDKCNVAEMSKKCKNGSKKVHPRTCVCRNCNPIVLGPGEIMSQWDGPLCDECATDADICKGTFDAAKCTCKCKDGWGGLDCDICIRNKETYCKHGTLDAETCKCTCNGGWTGDQCDKCGITCKFSKLNADTCKCEKMHDFVSAPNNDFSKATCTLTKAQCTTSNTEVDMANCRCKCAVGGVGDNYFCNKCPTGQNICGAHGTCVGGSCNCETGWGGAKCDVARTKTNVDCRSVGDPHPQTWDGIAYNYYAVGEFKYYWNENDGLKMNLLYWKSRANSDNRSYAPSYTKGYSYEYNPAKRGSSFCAKNGKNPKDCVYRFAFNAVHNHRRQCCFCKGENCRPKSVPCNQVQGKIDEAIGTEVVKASDPQKHTFEELDGLRMDMGCHWWGCNAYLRDAKIPKTDVLDGLCGTNADGVADRNKDCGGACNFVFSTQPNAWFQQKLTVARNEDGFFGDCNAGNVWGNTKFLMLDLAETAGGEGGVPEKFWSTNVWPSGKQCSYHPESAGKKTKGWSDDDWKVLRRLSASACVYRTALAESKGVLSVKGDKLCKTKLGGRDEDRLNDECDEVAVTAADFSDEDKKSLWRCKADACDVPRQEGEYLQAKTLVAEFAAILNSDEVKEQGDKK